jgi:hypothetical protein
MNASDRKHILIVANRTAATPGLLEEVRRRAREGWRFDLLVPKRSAGEDVESTLALALPLLEDAAGAPVKGLTGEGDPYQAVKDVLASGEYAEVIVSTLPAGRSEWLKRDLPQRIVKLGHPVTVVTAASRAGQPVSRTQAGQATS